MTVPTTAAPSTDGLAGWVVQVMDAIGSPGVGLLVFLENLFPPVPSEVVLPLAGFAASQGSLSLAAAIVWATLGSVLGAWALYGIGAALGRDRMLHILERMPLVDVADMLKAEEFFVRHGSVAIFFGRLVPMVRSLISIPAGLERLPALRFTALTACGSAIWNSVLILAGYALGERFGLVAHYLEYLQYAVIALVVLGLAAYAFMRVTRHRARRRVQEASHSSGSASSAGSTSSSAFGPDPSSSPPAADGDTARHPAPALRAREPQAVAR